MIPLGGFAIVFWREGLPTVLMKYWSWFGKHVKKKSPGCSSQIKATTHASNDAWWRHQMETFSALLALCAGDSPVTGEFPSQRPVTRSFDVFFEPRLNKQLSKQSWSWWSETPSRSLWPHCNGIWCTNTFYLGVIFYSRVRYTFMKDLLIHVFSLCTICAPALGMYHIRLRVCRIQCIISSATASPTDMRCNINVIITSKPRHDVVLM